MLGKHLKLESLALCCNKWMAVRDVSVAIFEMDNRLSKKGLLFLENFGNVVHSLNNFFCAQSQKKFLLILSTENFLLIWPSLVDKSTEKYNNCKWQTLQFSAFYLFLVWHRADKPGWVQNHGQQEIQSCSSSRRLWGRSTSTRHTSASRIILYLIFSVLTL